MAEDSSTSGFCLNSNRWIAFMTTPPETCPYPPAGVYCENCGYYCDKEKTSYFKRKFSIIEGLFS